MQCIIMEKHSNQIKTILFDILSFFYWKSSIRMQTNPALILKINLQFSSDVLP